MDEPVHCTYVSPVTTERRRALQILILLSAMIASLTGLMVGERPVARAQVERSVAAQPSPAASSARPQAIRPADAATCRRKDATCAAQARAGVEEPSRRKSRSILLLKRAWLE